MNVISIPLDESAPWFRIMAPRSKHVEANIAKTLHLTLLVGRVSPLLGADADIVPREAIRLFCPLEPSNSNFRRKVHLSSSNSASVDTISAFEHLSGMTIPSAPFREVGPVQAQVKVTQGSR
ncbi:MAG: hypothetical protein OXF11_08130, partial [Deltaproteobacteria bacterium]|nr:hypothetical protein [Deltaproteobacteria bacterium]